MKTILPLPSQFKQIHIQYAYAKVSGVKTEEEGSAKMSEQLTDLFDHVMPALESKKSEFHLYQYTSVTEADIWNYCIKKKWKNRDVNEMRLYEIVNDILETLPAKYMTHTQIEESRTSNWFSQLNQEELQVLLQTNINDGKSIEMNPDNDAL